MAEKQKVPADLFEDTSRRIKNLASKMDVILFGVKLKNEKDRQALIEDVVTLQCFHIAVYRQPSQILDEYITSLSDKDRKEDKKKRKDDGAYFTPPFIAEYIVKGAMGPPLEKIKKDKRIKDKIKRILDYRVCDPAVGGGIFLVCAHDFLMKAILQINPNADLETLSGQVATKCIFGVDINPRAIEGCKLALHLNIAKWKLKKQIEEFASSAELNSGSPNDKCDSSERPPSAQEPAPESTSTPKTTRTKGRKKNARSAVNPSSSPTGTEQSDSVPLGARQTVDSQGRAATSKSRERSL